MARSKKRTFRRRKSDGRKADWVYRGDIHDGAGGVIDSFGSYVPGLGFVQAAGSPQATIHWLYDSSLYRKFATSVGGNVPLVMPPAMRAEGRKPLILRVQGWMSVLPTAWVAGTVVFLGMRFGVWDQSPNTGNGIFQANYNMWDNALNDNAAPATFANFGNYVREFRKSWSFDIGQTASRVNFTFNFACRRAMLPHQGFGIYTELAPGSTACSIVHAFRTLVVDES